MPRARSLRMAGLDGLAIQDGDADVQAAAPSALVRIAGRVATMAGVFAVVLGAQTFVNVRLVGIFAVAPFAQLLFGVVLAVSGWHTSRARGWAAIAATVTAALAVLSSLAFAVTALLGGYVSLMPGFVVLAGTVGGVLCAIVIGDCLRADRARERLAAQGLDMGL